MNAVYLCLVCVVPCVHAWTTPTEIRTNRMPHTLIGSSLPSLIQYRHGSSSSSSTSSSSTVLGALKDGGKKKRRRKPPVDDAVVTSQALPPTMEAPKVDAPATPVPLDTVTVGSAPVKEPVALEPMEPKAASEERMELDEIARFEFSKKAPSIDPMDIDARLAQLNMDTDTSNTVSNVDTATNNALLLPDIKEARKRKQEEELARQQQVEADQKVRIKRSDKEAFRRLLEQQPFADADDSYFEEEEYGTVAALLGERAKPFLAIPFGPLQVGHFIGALVFVLMAFIEYPGFPLTSLPSPVRACFQGGLATVYAINTVLAVVVAFQAPERGQPIPLWAIKTFSVGGLAYDQFMQLPTLAEIEKAKAVKGARAKNKKR